MTDKEDLYTRLRSVSDRINSGELNPARSHEDEEASELFADLMEQPMDTLLEMLGKAALESKDGKTFDLLGDEFSVDDYPSKSDDNNS